VWVQVPPSVLKTYGDSQQLIGSKLLQFFCTA
jgi:hypothetical protein